MYCGQGFQRTLRRCLVTPLDGDCALRESEREIGRTSPGELVECLKGPSGVADLGLCLRQSPKETLLVGGGEYRPRCWRSGRSSAG